MRTINYHKRVTVRLDNQEEDKLNRIIKQYSLRTVTEAIRLALMSFALEGDEIFLPNQGRETAP